MPGRSVGPLVALLAAGALIGACGDDDEPAADRPAAAEPAAFAIEATAEGAKKKAMTFPSTVTAGLVTMTLRNSDSVDRSAQIVRVTGDQTVEDVLKIVNAEETKIPSFMQDGGGIATAKPGATASATQVLAPGRYVIWDDLGGDDGDDAPGYDELGASGEFEVTGPPVDAELPAQPATVTATNDPDAPAAERYGFAFEGLKAGTNRVRFENTGTQLHHALFFPMRKGATLKQVVDAFASEEEPQGPPPVDFAKAVGTSVIDGGIAQNITLDLAAGRYAVVCFISDRNGGKPHAAKGMIEQLTVE